MPDPETTLLYHRRRPQLLVVDDFYTDPVAVRRLALETEYAEGPAHYKGLRSKPFLFPYVKEEFERLLGCEILDWMQQSANGVFQKTTSKEPLVWHSDSQSYAAAIYLNVQAKERDISSGTSFWQHNQTKARRPPESLVDYNETYSAYNLTHPDNWTLVDRVGSVFNRLVIWDAKLIHSATSYQGFSLTCPRLVQLFFFSIK